MARDFSDKLNAYKEANRIYRFEGDAGLDNLTKVVEAIGYRGHGFKYGTPIEAFLSDNPGAVDALVTWIEENGDGCPEWEANLDDLLDDEEDGEACPGCGCEPGDGYGDGCSHPEGCGYFKSLGM